MEFTKREEELMNYLWIQGKPMTSNDILSSCINRTWKDKYLPVMLRSLESKKAIEVCGAVQYGTQYARQFRPTLSKEEYYMQLAVSGGVDVLSFSKIAFNLASENSGEDKELLISELEEIIKEIEKRDKE